MEDPGVSLAVIKNLSYLHFAKLALIQFVLSNLEGSVTLILHSLFSGLSQHCHITQTLSRKALPQPNVEDSLIHKAGCCMSVVRGGFWALCGKWNLFLQTQGLGWVSLFSPVARFIKRGERIWASTCSNRGQATEEHRVLGSLSRVPTSPGHARVSYIFTSFIFRM